MTFATQLTVVRLVLAPVFMYFLLQQTPLSFVIATTTFVVASITDKLDGYLARKMGAETELGRMLDPLADKLLVGLAYVGFFWIGVTAVKVWMVAAIVGRELLVTGFRSFAGRRGVVIHSSQLGKWKTTLQMVTALGLLAMITIRAASNGAASYWQQPTSTLANSFVNVALIVTAGVTIVSGLDYVLKNRRVFRARPARSSR